MKILFITTSLLFFMSYSSVKAQKIEGKLSVSGLSSDTRIKQSTAVDIFKAFRDGVYKINFNYKANNVGKRGLVVFDMKTTVKHNGKVVSEATRGNWPWLPGDMFVPIEAFDLISALQAYTFEMPTPRLYSKEIDLPLPKGKYEVSLQMIALRPEAFRIPPAQFSFVID